MCVCVCACVCACSLVPRPSRGVERTAWDVLLAHARPFPEKPGNPRMFGNLSYTHGVHVRHISVS